MRHSWARQRASEGFQSAEHGGSPKRAFHSRIFPMMVSRVQRVTRRPPAVFADGCMICSVPLVAARLVDERHQAALAVRLEPRRRTRAHGLPDVDVDGVGSHRCDRRYTLRRRPYSRIHLLGFEPCEPRRMPSEVAPGVHRVGNAYINCYLIEDGNELTLLDAGVTGFRPLLEKHLRSRGRSVSDIAAVILTHGHPDHIGMAEGLRVDAPAPVHVHEADAHMARTGEIHELEGRLRPYMRYPAM